MYADSQVRLHAEMLAHHVLGNPHSASLSSSDSTTLVERARQTVLEYFRASGEYTAVFTLNASGALKHVGECFPFVQGSRFLLAFDNHNSVNGIREFATAKGATYDYAPLTLPDLRLDMPRLEGLLAELTGLAPTMPEERVAQELAMLVTRADVREELDRLRAHIAQAGELLQRADAVGRQLDFLCQELNREANTLCSKSASLELTRVGLALKAGIEQFREQVQNLE